MSLLARLRAKTRKEDDLRVLSRLVYQNLGYKYDDTRPSHGMLRGTIAMANSGPNTNGSQFFINMVDNAYLNGKHTVFGRVISGMEVVDKMATVKAVQARPEKERYVNRLSGIKLEYYKFGQRRSKCRWPSIRHLRLARNASVNNIETCHCACLVRQEARYPLLMEIRNERDPKN